jgi:hypothetical protein
MMSGFLHVAWLGCAPPPLRILLDASNLQLSLRPGFNELGLTSLDSDHLPSQLDVLSKSFLPAASCTAIFDGAAFDGAYAGDSWTCDDEVPDAAPVHVRFTGVKESADDELVSLAHEIGSTSGSSPAKMVTSKQVLTALEGSHDEHRPVYAVTLLRSAMGKGKRDKREAFLRSCGLKRMGDTVHLMTFLPVQQERSLALVRGLHSLERGVVRMQVNISCTACTPLTRLP